jgi:hypothetical protein
MAHPPFSWENDRSSLARGLTASVSLTVLEAQACESAGNMPSKAMEAAESPKLKAPAWVQLPFVAIGRSVHNFDSYRS